MDYSKNVLYHVPCFLFRFIIHLVLCYHNFYKRNIKECMEHLEELEKMMQQSSKKKNADYLFNTINDALYHVIHSCRIYIFDTTDQKERTKQVIFSSVYIYLNLFRLSI